MNDRRCSPHRDLLSASLLRGYYGGEFIYLHFRISPGSLISSYSIGYRSQDPFRQLFLGLVKSRYEKMASYKSGAGLLIAALVIALFIGWMGLPGSIPATKTNSLDWRVEEDGRLDYLISKRGLSRSLLSPRAWSPWAAGCTVTARRWMRGSKKG
jgi:hypothetical protein